MSFYSEISPEIVRTVVIPFINQHFSENSLTDYENKYMQLADSHGEIAVHVEAILVSCDPNRFPITFEDTMFYVYKLNRCDPELETIEVSISLTETVIT